MASFEYYKIAVDLHNSESQRYWERNNVFILVNGAFLAFLGTDIIEEKVDRLVICSIGFLFSYMWILILRQGKDLIERWRKVIHKYEDENDEIRDVFHTADRLSAEGVPISILPFSKLPPSGIMRWSAILVCSGWLAAFAGICTYNDTANEKNEQPIKECTVILSNE